MAKKKFRGPDWKVWYGRRGWQILVSVLTLGLFSFEPRWWAKKKLVAPWGCNCILVVDYDGKWLKLVDDGTVACWDLQKLFSNCATAILLQVGEQRALDIWVSPEILDKESNRSRGKVILEHPEGKVELFDLGK